MRRGLVLGVLLGLGSAHAGPTSKPTVLFEARWTSSGTRVVTKLFSTGMWTRRATTPGAPSDSDSGRLQTRTLSEISAALRAAKWKRIKAQATCLDVETTPIEIFVDGKKRYTVVPCGGWEIDDASTKALQLVQIEPVDYIEI